MRQRLQHASVLALALLALLPALAGAANDPSRQVKILGGTTAAPGQFPWMAALVDSGSKSALDGLFCGGTVIAPRVILTAHHCVTGTKASEIDVVTGRTLLSRSGDGQRIAVTKILTHPGYDSKTTANDLALLQLAEPAGVTPLAVAGAADAPLQASGARVVVSGWGTTSENGDVSDALRYVRLTVYSGTRCSAVYGNVSATKTVCAGSKRAGEDSCQGDSGGPLFSGDGSAARLLGIVSFGDGCGHAGIPAVYTRASAFASWIATNAAALNGDAPTPPPVTGAPKVRIGKITCGVSTCHVTLNVTGRAPAGGIVLNVLRKKSRGRKKVDRLVFAKRLASGRWQVTTDLPFGKLTLYAIPLDAAQDDLDGDGDVERIEIVPAR
jgi:secreted trypsin-like serine protease